MAMFSAGGLNFVQGCNLMLAEVTAVVGGVWRNHSSVSLQQSSTAAKSPNSSSLEMSHQKHLAKASSALQGPEVGTNPLVNDLIQYGMKSTDFQPQAMQPSMHLFETPPTSRAPTVACIMQEFHSHSTGLASLPARPLIPRSRFSHLCSRQYSSLAWNHTPTLSPGGRNLMARASLSVRYFWSKLSKLKELEDVANSKARDEGAQLEYLQAVLEHDPGYLVKRVESGRYAINKEIVGVYMKAVKTLDTLPSQSMMRTQAYAEFCLDQVTVADSSPVLGSSGSNGNPVQAEVTIKRSWSEDASYWIKKSLFTLFVLFCFVVALNYSSLNSVKGASKEMASKYSPEKSTKKYTFADVEGVDEAKEEIMEIVDFLKNPKKYSKIGAKLPSGVLLVGPPGTGKTLLAKAVAGEADVPFLFVSGSEFDEIFVGVGATRLRKLFETARSLRPCVLFIDELDAVGGKRTASAHHPYSRQTLNQLLVEMDGYKEMEGVIIMGATNFPEALDHALTRPGRFDTTITLTLPDVRARSKILEVHARKVQLDPEVDLVKIARNTAGFSGADLANLVNQAALKACTDNRDSVIYRDMEFARERILMGRERRSAVITEEDRINTAFHEAGHALTALYTPGSLPVHKATIIPRGRALGMVAYEKNDILSLSKKQLFAYIDVFLAGHISEEIIFGEENVTTGASNDFQNATALATDMVTKYGMSNLGKFYQDAENVSQAKRQQIDDEVSRILDESYERTKKLLLSHSVEHKRIAEGLLKYETLDVEEIKLIMAGKKIKRDL